MWARITTFQFPADDVDKAIAQLHRVADGFLAERGLKRLDLLVNRRTGAAVTFTCWESEEALRASEDDAERARSDVVLEVLGWIQDVEEYELLRDEQL